MFSLNVTDVTKAGYALPLPLPDQEDQEGLSGLLRLDHCRWSWAGLGDTGAVN